MIGSALGSENSKSDIDFIRFVESASGAKLETAVTRFEGRSGEVVDLIGAVHIADAKYYQDALGLIMTLKSAYDSSRALIKLTDELIKVGANLTVADISQADKNKLIIQALVIEKIKADNPDNWQELLSGQQVYATADNRSFSHDELIIASYSPSKP